MIKKDPQLGDKLLSFIAEAMPSVEQLDVLLLLHNHSDRTWNEFSVSDALRNNPDSGRAILESLNRLGLLSRSDTSHSSYQYNPRTEELGALVELLLQEYAVKKHRVIDAIYSRPLTGAVDFAEAFRVRKDD